VRKSENFWADFQRMSIGVHSRGWDLDKGGSRRSVHVSVVYASRDEPGNRHDRSVRKLPHVRAGDGASSPGPLQPATNLQACKLPKRARTVPVNVEARTTSMAQVEPGGSMFERENHGPADGRAEVDGGSSNLCRIECSLGGLGRSDDAGPPAQRAGPGTRRTARSRASAYFRSG
jgi:hypothetical protein